MNRHLLIVVAVLLIASAGFVRGMWSNRWLQHSSSDNPLGQLSRIPLVVGDWNGEALTLDARELKVARVDQSVIRRYVHRQSGDTVTMMVLGGQPGPISVHTPDICYRGSGFEEVGDVVSHTVVGDGSPHFRVRCFGKQTPTPFLLRVFYSWSFDGVWTAPEYPRLAFAGKPTLYKLYLIRQIAQPGHVSSDDPAMQLFESLRPYIGSVLASQSTSTPG